MKKPHYEIVEIDNVRVPAETSMIRQHDIWFNATPVAKSFGKQSGDFLRLASTKEHIREIFKDGISPFMKLDDLRKIKKGKNGGTWLHRELAFEFAGWCSASFRRRLHKWTEQRLEEEHAKQQARMGARTGYLPMTNAIIEAHKEIKRYHFFTEENMLNSIVLGMTAKKFKEVHEVDSVRDGLSVEQLAWIEKCQRVNTGLIEMGWPYDVRKGMLQDLYAGKVPAVSSLGSVEG